MYDVITSPEKETSSANHYHAYQEQYRITKDKHAQVKNRQIKTGK
jgi:hypothetical protein